LFQFKAVKIGGREERKKGGRGEGGGKGGGEERGE